MNPEEPAVPIPSSPQSQPEPQISPDTQAEEITNHRYGGFMTRYFATVIDSIIIFLVVGVTIFLLSLFHSQSTSPSAISVVINILQFLLYFVSPVYTIFFLYKYGATPGKRLLRLKVISANHEPLTIGRLFIREVIGKMLSGLFGSLGYFWYLFDENRQAWHDKMAHTLVIDTREISVSEYAAWHEKQKSALPLFILLSSLTPFFFLSVLYLISQLPQFQQYVVSVYPVTAVILTILMIILGINTFLFIAIGIWLYRKQITSPFLQGTPTKVGISFYLFFQVMTAVLLGIILMLSVFFIAAQFRTSHYSETTPSLPYDTILPTSLTPTATPIPNPDFLITMRVLTPLVSDKDWQPIIRDSLRPNPYKTPIYGYSRTYVLPQTNNTNTLSLLKNYSEKLKTSLPLQTLPNPTLSSTQADGAVLGFTQSIGGQIRLITFTYRAEWADLSSSKGQSCPCSGRFDVFYSDPITPNLLLITPAKK